VWLMLIALAATGAVVANVSVPLVYLIGSAVLLTQPVYAAVLVVLLTLLAAVLVPQLRFVAGRRLWPVPVTLTAATVVLAVLATTTNSTFTPDRPGRDSIEYLLDTDSRSATWISSGEEPDRWTRQFFKHGYAQERLAFSPGYSFGQKFDVITAAAPRVALPPPELTVLRDSTEAGQRRVVFRIASQRGAPMAHLDLRLPADLRALQVQGQDVKVDPAGHVRRLPLALYNLQRGMTVSVTVHGTGALAGTLTDYSNGLPHLPGVSVSRRPESLIPAPFDFRDPTGVRTRVSF
jgi:hypothetical protein